MDKNILHFIVNKNFKKVWSSSGLTQQELADLSEIPLRTLIGIFREETKVNANQIRKLLLAFPKINAGGKGHAGGFEDLFGQGE